MINAAFSPSFKYFAIVYLCLFDISLPPTLSFATNPIDTILLINLLKTPGVYIGIPYCSAFSKCILCKSLYPTTSTSSTPINATNVAYLFISLNKVSKDIEEISDDVEELAEDVEEIQDDMDKGDEVVHLLRAEREAEKTEEEKENQRKQDQKQRLEKIENTLEVLLKEIHNLRK
jgi:hypothetical protein